MVDIAENLALLRKSIAECEQKYGRNSHSVQLLAASKGQDPEKLLAAVNAGQTVFGENYLQEALTKIEALAVSAPDASLEWHFIGPIQSNKTRKIAEHFQWVQSVATIKIAERLNKQRPSDLPPLNICIEINVDAEPTKSGVSLVEAEELIDYCAKLNRLRVRGLMAIPKIQTEMRAQRAEFHKIYVLWQALRAKGYKLDTLSIGMTEDYEAAIAEGSTMVRIGKGIFGPRSDKHI